MATKRSVETLLRKYLSKDRAARVLRKIEKLAAAGASPAVVQREILKHLLHEETAAVPRIFTVTGARVTGANARVGHNVFRGGKKK